MGSLFRLVIEKNVRGFCESFAVDPSEVLPNIIRDLLLASGVRRDKIEMPGTRIHGYDIIVDEAPPHAEFVPPGRSVFELSVDKSPGVKADEDYA